MDNGVFFYFGKEFFNNWIVLSWPCGWKAWKYQRNRPELSKKICLMTLIHESLHKSVTAFWLRGTSWDLNWYIWYGIVSNPVLLIKIFWLQVIQDKRKDHSNSEHLFGNYWNNSKKSNILGYYIQNKVIFLNIITMFHYLPKNNTHYLGAE